MSEPLFHEKVVIVTGAGNGIGREEALYFAKHGARVVVNDVGGRRDGSGTDRSIAQSVVDEILEQGGDAIASAHSVSDLDGAQSVVWSALHRYQRVDVLVNNAGILRDRSLLNMTEAEWDAVIDVHLKGTFLMTRAFARALKQSGTMNGAIVNTSSLSGLLGNFGQTNYSAAKAGIYGVTRTASMELAKIGCRVNAIAPVALTRMTEDVPLLEQMGLTEMGPQHIAPIVAWLASSLAENITGRVFGVHGPKVFEYRMEQSEGLAGPPKAETWTPELLQDNLDKITFA